MKIRLGESDRLAALPGVLLLLGGMLVAQQPKITVSRNVQVSIAHSQENHDEVLFGADPTNPNRLIGCSIIFPDPLKHRSEDSITYTSMDRGEHWTPTLYVDIGDGGAGDPACGFGTNGHAYSAFLAMPPRQSESEDLVLYRSDDSGKTWGNPSYLDSHIDREYITVDTTGGKYNGRVYINGTGTSRLIDRERSMQDLSAIQIGISVQRSVDGGSTFKSPLRHYTTPPRWVLGMGNGTVLSDGTYFAVFGEQKDHAKIGEKPPYTSANSWLKVISSSDGGESYGIATVVSDWYMNYGEIGSTSSIVPVIAADRSNGPFRDRVYVVWPDFRFGRGQILLSFSADKGKTWTKPHVVNDDRTWPSPAHGPDDVMPVLDINKDGVVGVAWYDRRDNPHNHGWWVRFAVSMDGGETFSRSVRVSSAPASINLEGQINLDAVSQGGGKPRSWWQEGSNLQVQAGFGMHGFAFNGGHTAGMAADAGGQFHPFWIDNRTGVEQVWTAAVSVEGAAIVNGSPELASFADVTSKVTLDFKNVKFDRSSGLISMDAYLGNASEVTLQTPLLVRVLAVESKMGAPSIENANNHETGQGAIWDFSVEIPDARTGLVPQQVAKPKHLLFRLGDMHWGSDPPSAEDLRSFITFEAKVLAPKPHDKQLAAAR